MVKVVVVAGLVGVVRSISRVGLGRRVSDWHPRYRAARAAKNGQKHKLSPRSTFCGCTFCLLLFCLVSCCSFWRELKKETPSLFTISGCKPLWTLSTVTRMKKDIFHGTCKLIHISVWKGMLEVEGHQRSDIENRCARCLSPILREIPFWNILNKLATLR